jgi:sulfate/thiosulfate transport system ATP-binding protein
MAVRPSWERPTLTAIRVEGVRRQFSNFPALDGIDLDVRSGEFLALLGPSGSGKTTLLRIIAGLDFADEGIVRFDAEDVSRLAVGERHVGFVFQHYALFRHMTVAENIAFGLRVRKRRDRPAKVAINARVEELLALVQLPGLGARYPAQLSGGQRQRVALARALAVEPRILLLDEPFGALDAKVRKDLRRWLRQLHEEVGLTSIFVTHDQEEAMDLADRVVVMNKGRIEQVGAPAALYAEPASTFVYDFVGESNRVAVNVDGSGVHYHTQRLAIGGEGAAGPATLTFRPHEARLVKTGGIPAVVTSVRPRGGLHRVEARTADDSLIELDATDPLEIGTTVEILPANYRLFGSDPA